MQGALSGVKILDLSRLLPGAFCSMLMADMGADVIKVEDPAIGDAIRWFPPKFGPNSGMHVVLNRNKRSITINLKTHEGKKIFEALAATADVVLESFRPGVMNKLGLGYEKLAHLNQRIIYCAISGYGAHGPMSEKAGHDINYLALNGVLSFSGRQFPTLSGVQIADIGGGGLMATTGILAALFVRERMGRGQFVDVSMMDGALAWNCIRWGKFIADGAVPKPADDFLNHGFACYNIYETRDGRHMTLGAIEPQFWKAFCRAAGRNDWASSEHFKPGPHQKALTESIAEFFGQKTLQECVSLFEHADCCCEPVLNMEEVMESQTVKARGMVVDMVHQSWGSYRQLGIVPRFSLTPGEIRSHAPDLGEHTSEVLTGLGYSASRIAALKKQGVL